MVVEQGWCNDEGVGRVVMRVVGCCWASEDEESEGVVV